MLNNYSSLEKQYNKKITSIVVYCGGISYEDAWALSPQQFEMLDETVNEKLELMIKLGKASLF
jgi:hypothetical protein